MLENKPTDPLEVRSSIREVDASPGQLVSWRQAWHYLLAPDSGMANNNRSGEEIEMNDGRTDGTTTPTQ